MKYILIGLGVFVLFVLVAGSGPTEGAPSPAPTATPKPPNPSPSPSPDGDGYRHPVINQGRDPGWYTCRHGNPSCGRDPWWKQFEERPLAGRCQYALFGPGFVSDCALAEAVIHAAQWEEGLTLLRQAAEWKVTAVVAPQAQVGEAVAHYGPNGRIVRIGDRWHTVSTWMLAAMLVHELTHAHQHQTGVDFGSGPAACMKTETPAYTKQAEFTKWVAARQGGLPPTALVQRELSADDKSLFASLTALVGTGDIAQLIAGSCTRAPHVLLR